MDLGLLDSKTSDIMMTANTYRDKLLAVKENYVLKINECLDELEKTINSNKSEQYIQMRTNTLTDKINNLMGAFKKVTDQIINQLNVWYDTQMNNIKKSVITGASAKLGINLDNDAAQEMANSIPHPNISSTIPDIGISLDLSGINAKDIEQMRKMNIPRL